MTEIAINQIMRQVMAHLDYLQKDDALYNAIEKSITNSKEKRDELLAILLEAN